MLYRITSLFLFTFLLTLGACKNDSSKKELADKKNKEEHTTASKAHKTAKEAAVLEDPSDAVEKPEGMVWIPGGNFDQGAVKDDEMSLPQEKPAHPVAVDGFFMDITEVTNAQFKKFVKETGYVTVAEREVDWEELKKQVPEGTPKPADSLLQPGALVFKKTASSVPNLYDYSQWWEWKIGANWKHPEGPKSSIEGKDNYPVVQISFEDAQAYCKWAGRRLPTEAEWELAARANQKDARFTWGSDAKKLSEKANTWEGEFPTTNTEDDGFEGRAPVKSFDPNPYGLYDMAGNVWEWTQDWFNADYYEDISKNGRVKNPEGAKEPYNPSNPNLEERVIKGGSYLCNESYCASFRISARMASSTDSAQEHLGFRTIATVDMLEKQK